MSVSAVTARLITMSKGDKMWLSRRLTAKSTVSNKDVMRNITSLLSCGSSIDIPPQWAVAFDLLSHIAFSGLLALICLQNSAYTMDMCM